MGRYMSPLLGPLAIVLLGSFIDNVLLVVPPVMVIDLAFVVTFSAAFSTFAGLAFDGAMSGLVVGGGLEGTDLSHTCSFPLPESVRHFDLTLPIEIHAGLLFHESCCWVVYRLRGHNVGMSVLA